ncbi:MAG TPA: hypothetical protein VGG74_20380 [Kofleriaceae bacterium]|jgi:hypothetical protein
MKPATPSLPNLSLEQLAHVTGGTSLQDRVQCLDYQRRTAQQRVDVGTRLANFKSADDYLAAQAAIEQPVPSFCASSPAPRSGAPIVP